MTGVSSSWNSPLWVVSTYYNPQNYQTRRQNFHTFRHFLGAPLLTVELSKSGVFHLNDEDSDILLQLTGEDAIWQKERLINIGIEHLPEHVKYVAWVDCDVIFENPGWVHDCIALFEKGADIVQPFTNVVHMPQGWRPGVALAPWPQILSEGLIVEESFVSKFQQESYSHDSFKPQRMLDCIGAPIKRGGSVHGVAWVASVDFMREVGLFDTSIVGGGDTFFMYAVAGMFDELFQSLPVTHAQRVTYADWYRRVQTNVSPSRLASLAGDVLHLWHGDMKNRNYTDRHGILLSHDFSPLRDIVISENGTWAWARSQSELAKAVAAYFASRREGGVSTGDSLLVPEPAA